jgi:hypothetical protein
MYHKTSAQFGRRRSNSFPSSPFCRCHAFNRQVNFSDLGAALSPLTLLWETFTPVHTLAVYRCGDTKISATHISAAADPEDYDRFSNLIFDRAQLSPKDESSNHAMVVDSRRQ